MALAARAADHLGDRPVRDHRVPIRLHPGLRATPPGYGRAMSPDAVKAGSANKPAKAVKKAVKKVAEKAAPAAKKAAAAHSHYHRDDPRPLGGYAGILASYGTLSSALALALRRRRNSVAPLSPMDLLLYALATEHLSRVITKDSLTSVLRAPFTRFQGPAGDGEVNEEVVATSSFGHAVGELLTCPFCTAQWVATALVAGNLGAPALTTAVISVSAAARASDYLNLAFGLLREWQE
jgi:Protein of unknown function (DUF1360)